MIPSVINHIKVRSINSKAFNDTNVTSLVIPDGIEYFGNELLLGNSKIEYLSIPSLPLMNNQVIARNCTALKNVLIRESDQELVYSNRFFMSCANLKSVDMPPNIHILNGALSQTLGQTGSAVYKLTTNSGANAPFFGHGRVIFEYSPDDFFVCDDGFDTNLYDSDSNILFINTDGVTDTLTDCTSNSCSATGFSYALSRCPQCRVLQNRHLSIPSKFCGMVASLSIPVNHSYTELGGYMGEASCLDAFTSLHIADGYTSIADKAFKDAGFKSIRLPSTLTTIGEQAFYNNQLTTLSLPLSLTTIGSNGSSAEDAEIRANVFRSSTLETAIIECEVGICQNIFKNCERLRTIYVYNLSGNAENYTPEFFGLSPDSDVQIIFGTV